MKDNWNDEKFVTDWDTDSAVSNKSRTMLIDLLISIIADNYKEGNKILDLGFGSGHVEKQLFSRIPKAQVVGVDASEVMMQKAKEKLAGKNVAMIQQDLNKIDDLKLPEGAYQFGITTFVLHEITPDRKRKIFEYIYKTLMSGGMYILIDRFKIDSENLTIPYESQWKWQGSNYDTFEGYKKKMSEKDDSPDSVEDQIKWLREIGFKADCLQLQLDRGLIVGVK